MQSGNSPGSTFHFTAILKIQKNRTSSEIPIPYGDLRRKRILIVDDNATNRQILKKTLSIWGFYHDDAASGPSAIKLMEDAAARDQSYDMVLMDGQMPMMDGFDTSAIIKGNTKLSSTIIVMVSSVGLRGEVVRCKEVGIDGYLLKPVKQADLYDAISMALGEGIRNSPQEIKAFVTEDAIHQKRRDSRIKILLAEDNEINQKMAMNMLKKMGHDVAVANNGSSAIDMLDEQSFDLVLMDVQMPVMDGLTATLKIRNLDADTRGIPIIAMTAHAMKGDKEKCIAAGMNDYISKPIDPQKLRGIINKHSDQSKST